MNLKSKAALMSSLIVLSPYLVSQESLASKHSRHSLRLKAKIEREVVDADDLMMKSRFAEAADMYRDAINKDPKNENAITGFGMALGRQFKLDAAEEQFQKALTLNNENANAHIGLAMVAMNRLQSSSNTIRKNRDTFLKQAEFECQTALGLDQESPEAHFWMGQTMKEEGSFDAAASEFAQALGRNPKYSEAYSSLGLTRFAQNNVAEAVSNLQQAIRLNSGNSTAHFGLGRARLAQADVDAAIKEFNTALYQNRNSAPTHLALGDAYNQQGNLVAAMKHYQEAIRIKPETPEAYLRIAAVREGRGDIEHSIAELRSALELVPNNAELYERIAADSLRLEKIDDAIKNYEQVLSINPGSSSAATGITRAYYLKSQKEATSAFFVSNDFEKAMHMMNKAIALNPNDMELRLAQAKMRALSGEKVDLSQVGTPKTEGEKIAYAEALLAQNKFAEAQSQISQLIASAPSDKQLLAVADLCLLIRDLDDAKAAYSKAATMSGAEGRAKRGLDQVARARDLAHQDLTLAMDLSRKNQFQSSVDKFHNVIFADPKNSDARVGLAQTLERMRPNSSDLKEAITQYRVYIDLNPALPQKEAERLDKHIGKLIAKAGKLEGKEKRM